jgi:ATP phosphoribosyltransferase
MESLVTETLRLGFGKCALQVQVPEAGPLQSVDALAGKRIVTSFEVLAGRYFADVDDGVGLVGDARTSIEYVGGSVEAACALGLADAIGASCILSPVPSTHPPQSPILYSHPTPSGTYFQSPTFSFSFSPEKKIKF